MQSRLSLCVELSHPPPHLPAASTLARPPPLTPTPHSHPTLHPTRTPPPLQVMWKDETGEEIDTGLVRVLAVKQTAGGVKIAGIGGSGAGAGFGGGEKAEGDDDGGGDDGEEAEETK